MIRFLKIGWLGAGAFLLAGTAAYAQYDPPKQPSIEVNLEVLQSLRGEGGGVYRSAAPPQRSLSRGLAGRPAADRPARRSTFGYGAAIQDSPETSDRRATAPVRPQPPERHGSVPQPRQKPLHDKPVKEYFGHDEFEKLPDVTRRPPRPQTPSLDGLIAREPKQPPQPSAPQPPSAPAAWPESDEMVIPAPLPPKEEVVQQPLPSRELGAHERYELIPLPGAPQFSEPPPQDDHRKVAPRMVMPATDDPRSSGTLPVPPSLPAAAPPAALEKTLPAPEPAPEPAPVPALPQSSQNWLQSDDGKPDDGLLELPGTAEKSFPKLQQVPAAAPPAPAAPVLPPPPPPAPAPAPVLTPPSAPAPAEPRREVIRQPLPVMETPAPVPLSAAPAKPAKPAAPPAAEKPAAPAPVAAPVIEPLPQPRELTIPPDLRNPEMAEELKLPAPELEMPDMPPLEMPETAAPPVAPMPLQREEDAPGIPLLEMPETTMPPAEAPPPLPPAAISAPPEEEKGFLPGLTHTFRNLLTDEAESPPPVPSVAEEPLERVPEVNVEASTLPPPHLPPMQMLQQGAAEQMAAESQTLPSLKKLTENQEAEEISSALFGAPAAPEPALPETIEDTSLNDPLPPLSEDYEVVEINNKPVAAATNKEAQVAALPPPSEPAKAPAAALQVTYGVENTDVPDAMKAKLLKLATQAKEQNRRIRVTAYASGKPDESKAAHMVSLSRALSLRAFLIDAGVDMEQIIVKPKGLENSGGTPDRADLALE